MKPITQENIRAVLQTITDPVLKNNLIDGQRIARLEVNGDRVILDVEVANPALHSKKKMEREISEKLLQEFGTALDLNLNILVSVVSKRKDGKTVMPGVKNIVAVASGKGGVGKSTVAVNLAVALTKMGAKVALVDADIYGPSIPIMLDTMYVRPSVTEVDGKTYINPVENYGIKMLSIGFFADINQPVVWRGPMASKALSQMFVDAMWGELDYMIIDLPPGTGDIHLTLVQAVPLTGVVIVSTPQDVALADARKGVGMFKLSNINVPILGLVENMAWFTPEELPDNKYYIFGKNGVKELAKELGVPLLGEIPLVQGIREAGDIGVPAAMNESDPSYKYFMQLAENLVEEVEKLSTSTE